MNRGAFKLLLAACLAGGSAAALAQASVADEIARYRAMLQDGNPAELTAMRGEQLWKTQRGPKQVSLRAEEGYPDCCRDVILARCCCSCRDVQQLNLRSGWARGELL